MILLFGKPVVLLLLVDIGFLVVVDVESLVAVWALLQLQPLENSVCIGCTTPRAYGGVTLQRD